MTDLLIPIIVVIFVIYIFLIYTSRLVDFSFSSRSKGGNFYFGGHETQKSTSSWNFGALIKATKAGLTLSIDKLEAHYLAGGNVDRVVDALIAARRAGISLSFEKATAIDLVGRNVLEAVQMSVNSKVIKTPVVAAVAKNGIQVMATARVTVRANIERLVGEQVRKQ